MMVMIGGALNEILSATKNEITVLTNIWYFNIITQILV